MLTIFIYRNKNNLSIAFCNYVANKAKCYTYVHSAVCIVLGSVNLLPGEDKQFDFYISVAGCI